MLNTLMQLQLENEHLETKLKALKAKYYPPSSASYSTSSPLSSQPQRQQADNSSPFYLGSEPAKSPVKSSFDSSTTTTAGDEDVDDGQKKKKLKKMHPTEQYVCVTCGRTDSPEWRKGPLGPKTLCNACGLRWAKQMRKPTDEPLDAGGGVESG